MKPLTTLNRFLFPVIVSCAAIAIAPANAFAASPSFSNGTFETDTVLNMAGTEVYGVAIDRSAATITTANNYFFNGSYGALASTEISNINAGGFFGNFISGGSGPSAYAATTGDAGFDSVLQTGSYNGGPVTYTLNGLVGGLTYNVLVLMADNRPPQGTFTDFTLTDGPQTMGGPSYTGDDQSFRFADGTGVVATDIPNGDPANTDQVEGGYLLDTFTEAAGSTSHVITVGTSIEVSGILVGKAAIPEPSSVVLFFVGLGAATLLGLGRLRSHQG